ncbi:glycoside hydrolase family 5 protein [Porcipelethomonas sp.]|uniref:glycoside hydrolase family 5 protein n=1 Tax=Porcipelethomonas sp. TaxID=2981675 RepID=UPI003076F775
MFKKKLLSVFSAAAVAVSMAVGAVNTVFAKDTGINGIHSQGETLGTFLREDYLGYESIELDYKYESETLPSDAENTFAFLVFDTEWGGWDKINVGQNNPVSGQTYSQTVPISTIESALSTNNSVYGFNLITDNFGAGSVTVNSVKLIDKAGQEEVITGSWHKGTASTMNVDEDSDIIVDANAYNIYLNGFSAFGFTNPTVDVTVTYDNDLGDDPYKEATLYYVENFQQENEVFTPVEAYGYKKAAAGETVTYSFSIDGDAHKLAACFDACTVTEIKICDKIPDDIDITGSWTKGETSSMESSNPNVMLYSGADSIYVYNLSLKGYMNPTVEVTANYSTIPEDGSYMQAELYSNEQKIGGAYVPVTKLNQDVVYTFDVSNELTEFNVCFDGCTVTNVKIYDNRTPAEYMPVETSGLTASQIAENMGKAWNLGNALESTIDGVADETLWNNKFPVSKEMFDAVRAAGFQTVRIPVSYLDKITYNSESKKYSVDDTYMARVKQVVDSALASGLYVVIDMHNDGSDGAYVDENGVNQNSKWLDITKTGTEFNNIKTKFANVWSDIATTFTDYDQHLLFEGFNELNNGYDTAPTTTELNNITALNSEFVTAVRNAGGNNTDRVLIVNGYNANIDYTVSNFAKPTDTSVDRLMLSVHYYDPSDFALNEDGIETWNDESYMRNQFNKISEFSNKENIKMPVFIGEYGAIDKGNTNQRINYLRKLNQYANQHNMVTAYWDNGYDDIFGFAIFNRNNYQKTSDGQLLINAIFDKN